MVAADCSTRHRPSAAPRPSQGLVAGCFDFLMLRALWTARWRFRRDLHRLSRVGPHMLADIGLDLEEAQREAAKPFWRA